ncbi:MAG: lipid A phosphoethanolamine transferase [Bacteroides sp.]|nr:lipid A phosphoethanolamine transferase [Bacteroides sp.]
MKFCQYIRACCSWKYTWIVWFMVAMLFPNLILVCTEPYRTTTCIASLLLPAAFYLLWVLTVPCTGKMILCAVPFMVLAAFQIVISFLFGNSIIAVDMFTNLFTTNPAEAGELLASIYPAVMFVCILYLPLIVGAVCSVRRKDRLEPGYRKRLAIVAVVLAVTGMGAATVSGMRNPGFAFQYHIFPVNVCYNIQLAAQRWKHSLRYFDTSEGFCFNAQKEWSDDQREIYVLVIGEASRASSWSLFGYDRDTTPQMSAMQGLVPFRDVLTQSNTTHKSVPIILSPCAAENYDSIYKCKSIVTLFREAGFRTAFISNQPANKSLTEFFASEADQTVDITLKNGYYENRYDGEMIPELRRILFSSSDPLFVVMHMYGSHVNHSKRYPKEVARFLPDEAPSVSLKHKDKIVHAYDNSIYYTDHVLAGIISLLEESGARTALLYCSDHGEDLLDDRRGRFLHASPTTTYYQLHTAAFAWFSPEYIDMYPEKFAAATDNMWAAATTAAVFHTVGDLADIHCDYLRKNQSLVNSRWEDLPRMYINDYNKAVNVLNTGLMEEDLRMFDRYGIRYNRNEIENIKY